MPAFFSSTWRPTTSTTSVRDSRSWIKPWGITPAVYGSPGAGAVGGAAPGRCRARKKQRAAEAALWVRNTGKPAVSPVQIAGSNRWSDGEIFQRLAARQRGGQPLGLQASTGPGLTGGRVAVFGSNLLGAFRLGSSGGATGQIGGGQALFGHQHLDLGNRIRPSGALGFRNLLVEFGPLGQQVLNRRAGHSLLHE